MPTPRTDKRRRYGEPVSAQDFIQAAADMLLNHGYVQPGASPGEIRYAVDHLLVGATPEFRGEVYRLVLDRF